MKVQNDVRVTIRVDKNLKEHAEDLFDRLGMNMSTAFNVFLRKSIDEGAIPFPVSTKSNVFGSGFSSNDITSAFTASVQNEIEVNRLKGFPIARYDADNKKAYLEAADGMREYVNE